MNEYNEDQKRAIETAYAMVKQHPGLPKICLIHGPPGTGKSKTIVGLLSRVLREVSEHGHVLGFGLDESRVCLPNLKWKESKELILVCC